MRRRSIPRTGTARNVQPKAHDPYQRKLKAAGPLVCRDCGLVFHDGRWAWTEIPEDVAKQGHCPACQRIHDRYPAGTLRLTGLPSSLRDEITSMIRNIEASEKMEHPLERLIDVEDRDGAVVVTTTGMHLARCIAGSLRRRFHGGVHIHYPPGENLVQVDWTA